MIGTAPDPEFGEGIGTDEPRASGSIYVRQPLNEYTDYEEVFEFGLREPQADEMNREPEIVTATYYITLEARNGVPGIDDYELNAEMIPIDDVPPEVIARALQMIRQLWNGME